jgi:hypothetical protein
LIRLELVMENQDRVPVFELHIRPMIRMLDREHMAKWVGLFDLWDITEVWQHRQEILTRIRDTRDMPGTRYGGPWPLEWVRIFERWVATGSDSELGHHLTLATTQGNYQVQSLGGEKRRLTVSVAAPSASCRAWFELESVTAKSRDYTLYLEPAFPSEELQPNTITALEGFIKGSATQLVVKDAAGSHEIALT